MTKKKPSKKHSAPILRAVRGEFYESVAEVLRAARSKAFRAVNFVMVEAYWNVGRMIVEEEQQGRERAEYGEALIRSLSERLTLDFGKGFNVSNLWAFKQFYSAFPILRTPCGESSEMHQTEQCGEGASLPARVRIRDLPREKLPKSETAKFAEGWSVARLTADEIDEIAKRMAS